MSDLDTGDNQPLAARISALRVAVPAIVQSLEQFKSECSDVIMRDYFIDAHRFTLYKLLDFAKQASTGHAVSSSELPDLKSCIMQTLCFIAVMVEHAQRRKKLVEIASDILGKKGTDGERNFGSMTPKERDVHVAKLIEHIKLRETELAGKRLLFQDRPFPEVPGKVQTEDPTMDAVKSLFGITAQDLADLVKSRNTAVVDEELGRESLVTVVSDVMLRYVSRFFVVELDGGVFYIDFILADDDLGDSLTQLSNLTAVEVAETSAVTDIYRQHEGSRLRFLQSLQSQLRVLSRDRQQDTLSLEQTKFVYQKYLLPYERAEVSPGNVQYFRQGPIKLPPGSSCIVCFLPGYKARSGSCRTNDDVTKCWYRASTSKF